jgi:type IV secretory pathway VirB2 component (pilin)
VPVDVCSMEHLILLDVQDELNGFLRWVLDIRPILCSIAGIISIARIAFLWMNARDKRAAIERTVCWVVAIVVFFVGFEVIDELNSTLR